MSIEAKRAASGNIIAAVGLFVIFLSMLSYSAIGNELVINANSTSGSVPMDVAFSAAWATDPDTTPLPSSYEWDFNSDGTTDSEEASPTFTYTEPGQFTVNLATESGNATALISAEPAPEPVLISEEPLSPEEPIIEELIKISIVANPETGKAPLSVQFTSVAVGKAPLSYEWDFDNDSKIDSTLQNPAYTYKKMGEYNTTLRVKDGDGNIVVGYVQIAAAAYDSHLALVSCFPSRLKMGANQVVCILKNEGEETVEDITGKVIGVGVQYTSSSDIPKLNPGDEDSITLGINALQSGDLTSYLKVEDKMFPLKFEVGEQKTYSKEEVASKYEELNSKLDEQEKIYYEKKAEDFPVENAYDSIKGCKQQAQDIQQMILTDNIDEAGVKLDILSTSIADLTTELVNVQKQKVTFMKWIKENALAVTAIVAALGALGTLGGLMIKAMSHAKKMKDQVKQKFPLRRSQDNGKQDNNNNNNNNNNPSQSTQKSEETKAKDSQENKKEEYKPPEIDTSVLDDENN